MNTLFIIMWLISGLISGLVVMFHINKTTLGNSNHYMIDCLFVIICTLGGFFTVISAFILWAFEVDDYP